MDPTLEASPLQTADVDSSERVVVSGTPRAADHLSFVAKLLYGAPNLAAGAMAIPLLINMPKFYADVVAVPLAQLAIAIAATRCLDAIIDPSIGLISDRTRSRW